MTKKDYELIQGVFEPFFKHHAKEGYKAKQTAWYEPVLALTKALENENPKFDRYKFLNGCGVPQDYDSLEDLAKDEQDAMDTIANGDY